MVARGKSLKHPRVPCSRTDMDTSSLLLNRCPWREVSPYTCPPRRFSTRSPEGRSPADDPKRSSIRSKSMSPTRWRYKSLTSAWSSGCQPAPGEKVKPYKPASPSEPDTLPAGSRQELVGTPMVRLPSAFLRKTETACLQLPR